MIVPVKLSGSTDGKGILVVATTTPGTAIHTAVASTNANTWDELWLWAMNTDSVARDLTIEFGGTAAKDKIIWTLQPKIFTPVVRGLRLQNSAAVAAFAAAASVVGVHGFVHSLTP